MQKYHGHLYAVLIPGTDTDEETGETILTHEYVFEGVEGIQYCVPTIQATEEENSYTATISDPAISDGHTSIFVGDDENSVSLDGTIFVAPSNKMNIYYFTLSIRVRTAVSTLLPTAASASWQTKKRTVMILSFLKLWMLQQR